MRHAPTALLVLVVLVGSAGLAADEPSPCSAPEYRQFDFWVGEWDVVNQARPDATPARSTITVEQKGCVIREEYRTPGGYSGTSLTFFDASAGAWHQTWIDNEGQPIFFDGDFDDGRLVVRSPDHRYRMIFTRLEDGSVRQQFDSSDDGGETWNVVFDGVYTRRPG